MKLERLNLFSEKGVATITIHNPPVNVLDVALMKELRHVLLTMRDRSDIACWCSRAPILIFSLRMSI